MAKVSFFKVLLDMEKKVVKENSYLGADNCYHTYSNEARIILLKLIGQIESAEMFKSKKSAQFICSHWRLNNTEIAALWEQCKGKSIRVDTVRGQISKVSNILYNMYGDINEIFAIEDTNKLKVLDCVIEAIKFEELHYGQAYFCNEVYSFLENCNPTGVVDITDCSKEIVLLSKLTVHNINNMIRGVSADKDKLVYIVSVIMNQRLYDSSSGHINMKKVKILKELCLIR